MGGFKLPRLVQQIGTLLWLEGNSLTQQFVQIRIRF